MFRLCEINHACGRNSRGAGGGAGVPFDVFASITRGWSGLELSLTCPQGDIAEDPEEEGKQAKASGTG
jgi:hypothetical protein